MNVDKWNPEADLDALEILRNDSGTPGLRTILRLISEVADSGEPRFDHQMRQLIEFASLQLRRWQSSRSAQPAGLPRRGLARWQVKRVTAYMRGNLEKDIALQELAKLVNLSHWHFCRAFRIATGYTPHEWLTKLRINEAQRLLNGSSISITDIALTVGYQTPSAFAATFRRLVGISPREFRSGV